MDSYFADPSNPNPVRYARSRPVDERGYVVRRSVMEEGTRPEYIIPVSSSDGVWGMVKRIGRFNAEGWLALFKGEPLTWPGITAYHDIIFCQGCSPLV